jgi:hypothetical protein
MGAFAANVCPVDCVAASAPVPQVGGGAGGRLFQVGSSGRCPSRPRLGAEEQRAVQDWGPGREGQDPARNRLSPPGGRKWVAEATEGMGLRQECLEGGRVAPGVSCWQPPVPWKHRGGREGRGCDGAWRVASRAGPGGRSCWGQRYPLRIGPRPVSLLRGHGVAGRVQVRIVDLKAPPFSM